ncbi:GNAT family N-acetyltransferase [Massilia sp. Dwa41.01b]|uniref:GNAT family N-acetyltransferase n=1 Tax=unclassified Massilia TaxID=2609279 RepID=UPI001600E853|nr:MULTISPECIES: GNAT family N-acetyltransferase [unclassified Massilia]QNA91202.1 GNAT family N-acetyltransferase [Massilia sp. Dwa41.01b]QNB01282.1 GNAT family N-acetyltransferase [Massilia sp. Se16.2.3]
MHWFASLFGATERPAVLVKALGRRDRRRMLRHFLALDADDRLLRFGTVLPDAQIHAYVDSIDFSRDIVFGVVNRFFQLVGVGHLAFAPVAPGREANTSKGRVAEFGVSVSKSARGQGVGSKLFQRAAIHCRNSDVDTLYMQCLTSNRTMMHIAKKAGMEIKREYGEADAYLHLPPPSPGSVMREALEEQFAVIDYTVKANARAAVKWFMPRKR